MDLEEMAGEWEVEWDGSGLLGFLFLLALSGLLLKVPTETMVPNSDISWLFLEGNCQLCIQHMKK